MGSCDVPLSNPRRCKTAWTWGLELAGEGEIAGCLLVFDLEVALRACLPECAPHGMSLKRKTHHTLPLSRAVDNGACRFLRVWGFSYCRWREQDVLSALRCFVTSMNHIMVLLCGMY